MKISKLSINSAMSSDLFCNCRTGDSLPIDFKLKLLNFSKYNLDKINDKSEIDSKYDRNQGDFWVLSIELVCLYKEVIDSRRIHEDILIVDSDGFMFKECCDYNLTCRDDYSKEVGLQPFLQMELTPKIKYRGAILYYLPNEEGMEYSVAIHNGTILINK